MSKEKCPCETDANACCACVSMHCDECHKPNRSKFFQGRFCSNCGRPLKAELTRAYIPKSEVDRLNAVMKDMDEQRAYTINMLGENLENAKSEVERLQAEIETLKDNNEHLAVLLEEAKTEVACEIIGIIDKRMELKTEQCKGIHNEIALGVYRGQLDAYRDIKEIIKQKYTEEKT